MKITIICLVLLAVTIDAITLSRELRNSATNTEKQSIYLGKSEIRRAGQGVLETRTTQEAGHRALQENQWNSDDTESGGTSVVLSNLNSVDTQENDKMQREEAQEARKKQGDEAARKDNFNFNLIKSGGKPLLDSDANEPQDPAMAAENMKLRESKEKRGQREEQSQKQDDKFREETKKKEIEAATEAKQKQSKLTEAAAKKEAAELLDAQAKLRRDPWTVQFNQILKGTDLPFAGLFTYTFWIRPLGIIQGWSNIIHKGQDNVNRNPAVFFYPGTTRLHVRSGNNPNPTFDNGGNLGCDAQNPLPLNQWSHFALIHDSWGLRVFINGASICTNPQGAPVGNNGPLYVSDPWYPAAQVQLADFRYYPTSINTAILSKIVQERLGLS